MPKPNEKYLEHLPLCNKFEVISRDKDGREYSGFCPRCLRTEVECAENPICELPDWFNNLSPQPSTQTYVSAGPCCSGYPNCIHMIVPLQNQPSTQNLGEDEKYLDLLAMCLETMYWKGDKKHPEKINIINAFQRLRQHLPSPNIETHKTIAMRVEDFLEINRVLKEDTAENAKKRSDAFDDFVLFIMHCSPNIDEILSVDLLHNIISSIDFKESDILKGKELSVISSDKSREIATQIMSLLRKYSMPNNIDEILREDDIKLAIEIELIIGKFNEETPIRDMGIHRICYNLSKRIAEKLKSFLKERLR